MGISANKNQKVSFYLNDYYQNDLWIMDEHPRYKMMGEKQLRAFESTEFTTINFENIVNKNIKNELKYFFVGLFDYKLFSFTTIFSYAKTINPIATFINTQYDTITSITDIELSIILPKYILWLQENNYNITLSYKNKINAEMNKTEYKYDSTYIMVFKAYYKYIYDIMYPDTRNEYDKDIWDVRNLNINVNISESRARYTINFTNIVQIKIRDLCKKFIFNRLKHKSMSTVLEDMKCLNLFSKFINEKHPEIASLTELDRAIMEEYFAYVRTSKLNTRGASKRIGGLKLFFETLQLMGEEEAPLKTLIISKDYHTKDKALPKYFSDNELKQLNEHINELPLQLARMFFVIQNVGMRISDLCTMKVDCLKSTGKENYLLRYYQPKSNKWNTVPINDIVGNTIKEAIKKSKEEFGDDCKYVFAQSKNKCISSDTFSYHMNQLSFNNNIFDDTGNLLRIKSHVFRGTVATQYANLGIDLNVIKMMLGQSSLGVLKHYVTIHDVNMIECMKSITLEDNEYIANIGNIENIDKSKITDDNVIATPLPNGSCTKSLESGKCAHANACYSCRMFKPNRIYLKLYKRQLQESERNIEIAEINGFERLKQINIDLRNDLIKIIKAIEGE